MILVLVGRGKIGEFGKIFGSKVRINNNFNLFMILGLELNLGCIGGR